MKLLRFVFTWVFLFGVFLFFPMLSLGSWKKVRDPLDLLDITNPVTQKNLLASVAAGLGTVLVYVGAGAILYVLKRRKGGAEGQD